MYLSVEGNVEHGYFVNLGPGHLCLGPIYPTSDEAASMLGFHGRTCGVYPLQSGAVCAIIAPPHRMSEDPPIVPPPPSPPIAPPSLVQRLIRLGRGSWF